jgi:Oxidoreductase molybdopterin binding domain
MRGNRRVEMLNVRPIPGKDPWAHGAISTDEWGGARLADVLQDAGVHHGDGLHVAFSAPDVAQEALPVQAYGGSIPLSKNMSRKVLLAWQMNSETASTWPRWPGARRRAGIYRGSHPGTPVQSTGYANNAWAHAKVCARQGIRYEVAVIRSVILNGGTSLPVTIPLRDVRGRRYG